MRLKSTATVLFVQLSIVANVTSACLRLVTAALVDIPSESRHEARIADEVEQALREQTAGYEIIRNDDAVLARTRFGLPSRVSRNIPSSKYSIQPRTLSPSRSLTWTFTWRSLRERR